MTPELVYSLVAAVAGILLRHFFPGIKAYLPARTSDAAAAPVLVGAAPVVATVAPAAASKALTDALAWAMAAQVAQAATGHSLTPADVNAVKSLDAVIHSLKEMKS